MPVTLGYPGDISSRLCRCHRDAQSNTQGTFYHVASASSQHISGRILCMALYDSCGKRNGKFSVHDVDSFLRRINSTGTRNGSHIGTPPTL